MANDTEKSYVRNCILNPKENIDVYYIILDGYGGTKRMKQDLGFDNYGFLSEFIEYLVAYVIILNYKSVEFM